MRNTAKLFMLVAAFSAMFHVEHAAAAVASSYVRQAPAGVLASSGGTDEIRCASGGYDRGGGNWGQFSRCYLKVAPAAGLAGSTQVCAVSGSGCPTADIPIPISGGSTGPNCGKGTAQRTVRYGPQGSIPAMAVEIEANCATTGTYFAGLSAGTMAAWPTYIYPWVSHPGSVAWAFLNTADTADTTRSGNGGGIKWWGASASLAAAKMLVDWPPDWYPGGSVGGSACPGFSVSGPLASVAVAPGQSVNMNWSRTAGIAIDLVQYRWLGVNGPWKSFFVGGTIATSGTAPVVVPNTGVSTIAAGRLEFKCTATVGGVSSVTYLLYGGSGFTSVSGVQSPCSAAQVTWPDRARQYAVGEVMEFRLVQAAAVQPITSIEYAFPPFNTSGSYPAPSTVTWTVANMVRDATGTAVTPYTTAPLGLNASGFFGVPMAVAGGSELVWLRCTDSVGGTTYAYRWAYGGRGISPSDEAVTEAPDECVTSGLGWNPSSWVPGLVSRLVCFTYDMTVPSAATQERLWAKFDTMKQRPPLQWAVQAVDYISDVSFSFVSWESGGPSCTTIMGSEVCPSTFGGVIPPWVEQAVIFGLWSLTLFMIVKWF